MLEGWFLESFSIRHTFSISIPGAAFSHVLLQGYAALVLFACSIAPLSLATWAGVNLPSATSCPRTLFFHVVHCCGLCASPRVLTCSLMVASWPSRSLADCCGAGAPDDMPSSSSSENSRAYYVPMPKSRRQRALAAVSILSRAVNKPCFIDSAFLSLVS